MIPVKGSAFEGSGPGLIRVVGSFTTNGSNAVVSTKPSKNNITITRKGAGIYIAKYAQAGLSVVDSRASIGPNSNIVGAGSVAVLTAVPGYAVISSDFMTSDGTNYKADATNTTFLILCLNAANNALSDVYSLGNTSSKANFRLSFEVVLATSAMNQ